MAFILRPDETVARGLQRLATRQLRKARKQLLRTTPPADEAIHEARKSVKKVRAILHVITADHGTGLGQIKKRLQRVNRTLSQLRDADAMVRVLDNLMKEDPQLFSEHAFARIRRWLLARKQAAMDAAQRDGTWEDLVRQLRKLQRAAKQWRPAHRRFGALVPGMRKTHRSGRTSMERAANRGAAADFHEWRKNIKTLWYELRLVEAASKTIRRDAAALHRAEVWLGDDHNVGLLCADLSKDASVCGPVELNRFRIAANRYQSNLRKKALASVQRIYRRKSRAYLRGIEVSWKTKRRAAPTDRRNPRSHLADLKRVAE